MAGVFNGRYTVESDEPFVVFLIGMRFNRPLAFAKWLPVFRAMPKMLAELERQPDSGLLSHQLMLYWPGAAVIQYWRSFEQLERYAKDPEQSHLPAWRDFNRRIGADGSVGIWHEAYAVQPGGFECVYGNMPRFGLAAGLPHVPLRPQRQAARQRFERAD